MYSGTATLFFFILGVNFGIIAHKLYSETNDDGGDWIE